MDLTNKKSLKKLLAKYKIKPTKKLGQNFLVSQKSLEDIVRSAELSSEERVLEVGPGVGTLTKRLASACSGVLAVEKDPIFCDILKNKTLAGFKNVKVIQADIRDCFVDNNLNLDICSQDSGYKVVSNLPYYLSSFLIRKFLEAKQKPEKIVLTLQKELAERICAQPGQMSLLAVAVQFYSEPSLGPNIPKTRFYPSPNVDSRILVLDDIHLPEDIGKKVFFRVCRAGFAHKRKTLVNNLVAGLGLQKNRLEGVLEEIGLSKMVRAQSLSLEDWKRISTVLNRDWGVV